MKIFISILGTFLLCFLVISPHFEEFNQAIYKALKEVPFFYENYRDFKILGMICTFFSCTLFTDVLTQEAFEFDGDGNITFVQKIIMIICFPLGLVMLSIGSLISFYN